MTRYVILLMGNALLGVFCYLVWGGLAARRRRRQREALAESNRHTRLAAEALQNGHEEAYEFHMEQSSLAMNRALGLSKRDPIPGKTDGGQPR